MKILTILCITLSATFASASQMSAQGLLGFEKGAINIGGDFDFKMQPSHSFGGYFILASSKDTVRNQVWSLGADIKVMFGPKRWKLYLAPGFGITSVDLGAGKSETTFGPVLKTGVLYNVANKVSIGLEQMVLTNWFSDKITAGAVQFTNFVVRFDIDG